MLQQEKSPSYVNKSFGFTLGLLGLGFTFMLLVSYFSYIAVVSALSIFRVWLTTDLMVLINDICIYCLGLPCLLFVGHFLPNGGKLTLTPKKALPTATFAKFGCIAYALLYFSSLITTFLLAIVRVFMGRSPIDDSLGEMLDAMSPLTSFVLVAILPAILEELVFRSYLYKKLIRFGELPYIILSGFFFGTYHGNFDQFLYAFALGCLFAYLVCHTGTPIYGMMLHLLINFYSSNVATQILGSTVLSSVVSLAVLVIVGLGCFFFVKIRKTMYVRPSIFLPDHPVLRAISNPGMILWVGAFLAISVVTLMM